MRQIGAMRGIAILAVVICHAAGWGLVALAWWGPRFGDTTPTPNWNWINTPVYYGLMGVEQLSMFSVPVFLVAAGWYVSFATKGAPPRLTSPTMRNWLRALVPPYLLWLAGSVVAYIVLAKLASEQSIDLRSSITNRLVDYYFVPVLAGLYLLCPWLLRLARVRPILLLVSLAVLDMAYRGTNYLNYVELPLPEPFSAFLHPWGSFLPLGWLTYFALGLVWGQHGASIKPRLEPARWWLLGLAALLGLLSIAEVRVLNTASHSYTDNTTWKASTFLFALAAIAALICFDWRRGRAYKMLEQLGSQSYGIYLLQAAALEFGARAVYHFAPFILPYEWVLQPVMIMTGLGIPLLLMWTVAHSPAWQYQRLLFGGSVRSSGQRHTDSSAATAGRLDVLSVR